MKICNLASGNNIMEFTLSRKYIIGFFAGLLFAFAGCNSVDTGVSKPFPDCFDMLQNQGEQGVDCGGPCIPCESKLTAKIDGVPWSSQGSLTSAVLNDKIIIGSGNGNSTLSLIYTGPFVNGIYSGQEGNYIINGTPNTTYISNQVNITFTNWDNVNNQVSGTFDFEAFESSGNGDTVRVTDGRFVFVSFEP